MSIINDALKKAQQLRRHDQQKQAVELPKQPTRRFRRRQLTRAQFLFTWKMASLLTVTALLMMLLSNHDRLTPGKHNQLASANVAKPIQKVKVTLDGVLLSENSQVALINKQALQVGDLVNGMPIIKIDHNMVALKGLSGTITLKQGDTYL